MIYPFNKMQILKNYKKNIHTVFYVSFSLALCIPYTRYATLVGNGWVFGWIKCIDGSSRFATREYSVYPR